METQNHLLNISRNHALQRERPKKKTSPIGTKCLSAITIHGKVFPTSTYHFNSEPDYRSTAPVLDAEIVSSYKWRGHKIERFRLAAWSRNTGGSGCCWKFPGNPNSDGTYSWREDVIFVDGKFLTRGFGLQVYLGKQHLLVVNETNDWIAVYDGKMRKVEQVNEQLEGRMEAGFLPDKETILIKRNDGRGKLLVPIRSNDGSVISYEVRKIRLPLRKAQTRDKHVRRIYGNLVSGLRDSFASLRRKTFNNLVPDEIVRKVFEKLTHQSKIDSDTMNWAARRAVLDRESSKPFGENWLWAVYAEDVGAKKHYWKIHGVIMGKARSYLKNPKDLWSFYKAKKHLVVEAFEKMPKKKQTEFVAWLDKAIRGLQAFIHPKFQSAYKRYLVAEKAYRKSSKAYPQVEEATKKLNSSSPDPYSSLFAGRRYKEGGIELVRTYERIAGDLYQTLSAK